MLFSDGTKTILRDTLAGSASTLALQKRLQQYDSLPNAFKESTLPANTHYRHDPPLSPSRQSRSFLDDEYTVESTPYPLPQKKLKMESTGYVKKKKVSKKKKHSGSPESTFGYNPLYGTTNITAPVSSTEITDPFWARFRVYRFHQSNIHDYIQEIVLSDGGGQVQIFRSYSSGITIKFYSNGTARENMPHSFSNSVELSHLDTSLQGCVFYYLKNGLQQKQIFPNNDVVLYYLDSGLTCHIDALNGIKTYKWPNGHAEKFYPQPNFHQGSFVQMTRPILTHEIIEPDGKVYQKYSSLEQNK